MSRGKSSPIDRLLAFSAVVAAHRVNGGYFKSSEDRVNSDDTVTTTLANKFVANDFLAEPGTITDEDRQLAEKIITHFQSLSFKILGGKVLNDFEQKYLILASAESVTPFDIPLLAYAPQAYYRATKIKQQEHELDTCINEPVASTGDTVSGRLTAVTVIWSRNYDCYFVTAITDTNHAVGFASKTPVIENQTYDYRARVKDYRDPTTRLHYVKLK